MRDSIVRIYSEVPEVNCKGLCHRACGPIEMSVFEKKAIVEKHGNLPSVDHNLTCSKLIEKRCSIYEDRPLICRLYGATRGLPCSHGCAPKAGYLPGKAARKLVHRAEKLKWEKPE
jgi:hypothetical protein